MTVAYVNGSGFPTSGLSSSTLFNVSANANRLLLVQFYAYNNGTYATAATYAGVNLVYLGVTTHGLTLFYLIAPATGANNLDITYFANGNALIMIDELSGVDQTTPLGTYQSAFGLSTSPASPSITCPAGGMVFGGGLLYYSQSGLYVGANTTQTLNIVDVAYVRTIANGYRANTGPINFVNPASYDWDVHAVPVNAAVGGGPTAPGAPTIGTATAGIQSASVTFTAPGSNGGSAILDYTATASPSGLTATGATSPLTVTGLTAGIAQTLTVTARNAINSSSPSAASNSVTPTAPAGGTLTFPPLKINNEGLQIGITGIQLIVINTTGPALTVTKTNQSTHVATGVLVVSDAAIVAGTTYVCQGLFPDGSRFHNVVVAT